MPKRIWGKLCSMFLIVWDVSLGVNTCVCMCTGVCMRITPVQTRVCMSATVCRKKVHPLLFEPSVCARSAAYGNCNVAIAMPTATSCRATVDEVVQQLFRSC
eukprot:1155620-Pelagomonas_calceolata.AAC.2